MIFRQELRFQWLSWLTWLLSLLVLIVLFMSVFPLFEEEAEEFAIMLETLPKFMTAAIGMDFQELFTYQGYLAFTNSFMKVIYAVLSALWGLQICGRETINRMGEFLFCKPHGRGRVILQKILAGIVLILLLNLSIFGAYLSLKAKYDGNLGDWHVTLQASLLDLEIQLFFFSIGAVLGMSLKRIKNPVAIASGIAFFFFILTMLARIVQREWVSKLTPFYYAEQLRLLTNDLTVKDSLILLGASVSLLVAGSLYFIQKDVEA